jgi:hypothetical protein
MDCRRCSPMIHLPMPVDTGEGLGRELIGIGRATSKRVRTRRRFNRTKAAVTLYDSAVSSMKVVTRALRPTPSTHDTQHTSPSPRSVGSHRLFLSDKRVVTIPHRVSSKAFRAKQSAGPVSAQRTPAAVLVHGGRTGERGRLTRQLADRTLPLPERNSLDAARVQHDAHVGADGLRRQVLGELGADDAVVAVGTHDLAPDDAELGVVLQRLALVDVRDLLAKVEVHVLLVLEALDLDERSVLVLVAQAAVRGRK